MEFMDFPFLRDEAALSYVTSALTMFVMRGLPGSGKSTVVSVLLRTFPGAQVRSVIKLSNIFHQFPCIFRFAPRTPSSRPRRVSTGLTPPS